MAAFDYDLGILPISVSITKAFAMKFLLLREAQRHSVVALRWRR
jgi:hypothetical protein